MHNFDAVQSSSLILYKPHIYIFVKKNMYWGDKLWTILNTFKFLYPLIPTHLQFMHSVCTLVGWGGGGGNLVPFRPLRFQFKPTGSRSHPQVAAPMTPTVFPSIFAHILEWLTKILNYSQSSVVWTQSNFTQKWPVLTCTKNHKKGPTTSKLYGE